MTEREQQDKDALARLRLKSLMTEIVANAPDDTLTELKSLYDGIDMVREGEVIQMGSDLTLADFGEMFAHAMEEEMRPELNLYKKVCTILTISHEASPRNINEEELEKICYVLRKGLGLE